MNIFFDTSALAKHYVEEQGSQQVDEQLSIATSVLVASITHIELISAISKAYRTKRLSGSEYRRLLSIISDDFKSFTILPLNDTIESLAIEGIRNYGLKTLDAIQFASSMNRNDSIERIVVADKKLISVFQSMGKSVLDPTV